MLNPTDITKVISGKICLRLAHAGNLSSLLEEFFIINNMSNITIVNHTIDDGSVEKKEIYELVEKDSSKYVSLGRAVGINMDHCVILGSKHKEDFWHRVYGYRIIENKEMENNMYEADKKINPETKTETYMTVAFYERLASRRIMFVPNRLEITERPELNNFPLNIAFGTVTMADNNTERQETSLYEPDITTFIEEGVEQKMKYYNNLNLERRFWAEIIYNTKNQSYIGTKYRDDKWIGMVEGPKWDMFFVHFTLLCVGDAGLD